MTKEELLEKLNQIRQALQQAKANGNKQVIAHETPRLNYYFDEYQRLYGKKK